MNIEPKSKEVWLAQFPFEDNPDQSVNRPVIIVYSKNNEYLVIKLTKHSPRENDNFDVELKEWRFAHLNIKSTARVAKSIVIPRSQLIHKIGSIHSDDWQNIDKKLDELYEE